MFFYCTSSRFPHRLEYIRLADAHEPSWLTIAAKWAEDKWGYIRGFMGYEYRESVLDSLRDQTYMVLYDNIPIGMFVILDHHIERPLPLEEKTAAIPPADALANQDLIAKELMYFYVDESFRGLGIGSRILSKVKSLCNDEGADMIVLDTLTPKLNRFYEKHGAKIVCDSGLLGHETTLMRI